MGSGSSRSRVEAKDEFSFNSENSHADNTQPERHSSEPASGNASASASNSRSGSSRRKKGSGGKKGNFQSVSMDFTTEDLKIEAERKKNFQKEERIGRSFSGLNRSCSPSGTKEAHSNGGRDDRKKMNISLPPVLLPTEKQAHPSSQQQQLNGEASTSKHHHHHHQSNNTTTTNNNWSPALVIDRPEEDTLGSPTKTLRLDLTPKNKNANSKSKKKGGGSSNASSLSNSNTHTMPEPHMNSFLLTLEGTDMMESMEVGSSNSNSPAQDSLAPFPATATLVAKPPQGTSSISHSRSRSSSGSKCPQSLPPLPPSPHHQHGGFTQEDSVLIPYMVIEDTSTVAGAGPHRGGSGSPVLNAHSSPHSPSSPTLGTQVGSPPGSSRRVLSRSVSFSEAPDEGAPHNRTTVIGGGSGGGNSSVGNLGRTRSGGLLRSKEE